MNSTISFSIITLIFIIYLLCNIKLSSNNEINIQSSLLIGNRIACDQEGQIVEIPFIQKTDPCIVCMCRNSVIDCFRNDPNSTECKSSTSLSMDNNCYHYVHQIQQSNQTTCCLKKVCLSCRLNDKIILNGKIFQDNHSCQSYYCNSGTLTSSKMECYVPCERPIRFLGQCCPSCNACPYNIPDGYEVKPIINNNNGNNNHCIRCYCFKGQMICYKNICPVLPCPRSEWITSMNDELNLCCPMCKKNSSQIINQLINDYSCVMGDKRFKHLQKFIYDSCTECVCKNGTNICHRKLDCTLTENIKSNVEKFVENNQSSNEMCSGNQIKKRSDHSETMCLLSNNKNGRRCIINNSWSNITTFDNYQYNINNYNNNNNDNRFCNRLIAKDCYENKFSLHLLHKYRQQSINHSIINKYLGASLLLRMNKIRILLSHHPEKIRINRKLIKLPYIQMGQFSIIKEKNNNRIRLHAIIGINIWLQLNTSIEINLKKNFHKNICGLCGNYDDESINDEKHINKYLKINIYNNNNNNNNNNKCRNKFTNKTKSLKNIQERKNFNYKSSTTMICHTSEKNDSVRRFCDRLMRRFQKQLLINCKSNQLHNAYKQCLRHVCYCYNGHWDNRQCLCYAMQNFLDYCINNNNHHHLNNQTLSLSTELQIPLCKSLECPPGSEFNFCSDECRKKICPQKNQINLNSNIKCNYENINDECTPQCECIGNRRWHNNLCIPEMMCPLFIQ